MTTPQASGIAVHCAHTAIVDIEKVTPHPRNYNRHPEKQIALLAKMIRARGWRNPIVVSKRSGFIIKGHARLAAAKLLNVAQVPIDEQEFADEATEYAEMIADNRIAELAEPDLPALKDLLQELDTGAMDMDLTGFDNSELEDLMGQIHDDSTDAEPQIDRAAELQKQWNTSALQLWQLGSHRLICGDCTDAEVVARVMGGEKAQLVCADPPYGMGKENEGVANDNLYADKLDRFQMAWWRVARTHLEDNASAYIWGNAEDLWRLWYRGGLADSERMTFRNQIIWDKPPSASAFGSPIGSDKMRSMPHGYEVAFFFMLGEQGFNNNADNYWEGWEGIRSQLKADCDKMGWGPADIERICGVGMYGHWFTKSQWTFIPEEHYRKLQAAAREHDAFKREHDELKREHDELKREHDELKREFYATRAYFDNTHDNMTDVWDFPRVTGADRHGHATPKPVDMIGRCVKSSCPSGGIVFDGFSGSGTTIIACERLGRKARAVEVSPAYVAVALQRYQDATGKTPVQL